MPQEPGLPTAGPSTALAPLLSTASSTPDTIHSSLATLSDPQQASEHDRTLLCALGRLERFGFRVQLLQQILWGIRVTHRLRSSLCAQPGRVANELIRELCDKHGSGADAALLRKVSDAWLRIKALFEQPEDVEWWVHRCLDEERLALPMSQQKLQQLVTPAVRASWQGRHDATERHQCWAQLLASPSKQIITKAFGKNDTTLQRCAHPHSSMLTCSR
jgi:hypothetical protein